MMEGPVGRGDRDTAATARILVVDDQASVRDLVSTVLASIGGFEVETAADGTDAIARLSDDERGGTPDLVVLDVMMPGIDGFAVLSWLRRHEYLYDLPVVMLTARTERADEGEGWQRGCDAYVRKPFDPQELVEVVATTLHAGPELRIARRRQRLLEVLCG
jgi:DNA-binding response OmpR family regulator